MKKFTLLFSLILGCTVMYLSPAAAETYAFAKTTATSLNVRSIPNGKDVIRRLPQGSVVAIMQNEGAWAYILHLENDDPDKPRYGWVSSEYLNVLYTRDLGKEASNTVAGI